MNPEPKRCPLCGEPNACGVAAGDAACWCFSVKLDLAVLAKIPEAAKGKACVCRKCGELHSEAGVSAREKP